MIVEDGFWKELARHLSGPPRSQPETSRREQLTEAIAKVDRQLEILRAGPLYNARASATVDFGPEIAELEDVRGGLAQSLADLGPDREVGP